MGTYEQYNKLALSAPRHVRMLTDYFLANLPRNDPALALPAALAVVSTVRGQNYIHPSGGAPNLYIASIAPSGTGKTLLQKAIIRLFSAASCGNWLMGKPASDAGLLKSLQGQSKQLLIWDEFGIALEDLVATKATYKATLLGTMMELYSMSNSVYKGAQYSEKQRVDVTNPCLTVLAGSTPERFYDALSEKFVGDGFLSRWLIFERDNQLPTFVRSKNPKEVEPDDELLAWLDLEINLKTAKRGNLGATEPVKIKCPAICETRLHPDKLERSRASEDGILGIFWTRASEIHHKLLILASENGICDYDGADWAFGLAEFQIEHAIAMCRQKLFADNKSKLKAQFQELLKPGETITKQQLTNRALKKKLALSRSEREQLIDDLVEADIWLEIKESYDDSRKKTTCFRRTDLSEPQKNVTVEDDSDDDSDLDI